VGLFHFLSKTAALLPERVIVNYLFIAKESRAKNGYSDVVLPGFSKLVKQKGKPLTGFTEARQKIKIPAKTEAI
jgi:hypothetical protein